MELSIYGSTVNLILLIQIYKHDYINSLSLSGVEKSACDVKNFY